MIRLNETLRDKLTDQMPQYIGPKARILFYLLSEIEFLMILLAGIAVNHRLDK